MWLIVGLNSPSLIVGTNGCVTNAFLGLRDFSRSNKHCTHHSTAKTIYFSHFVFTMSAFAPISFLTLICNKSVAIAWICLVSSLWLSLPHIFFCSDSNWNGSRIVERKSLLSHMYLPQNNYFFHSNIILTSYFQYSFARSKFKEIQTTGSRFFFVFFSSVVSFRKFLIFHICVFSKNAQCFIGAFLCLWKAATGGVL